MSERQSGADAARQRPRFLALDACKGLAVLAIAILQLRWTHAEVFSSPLFDWGFGLVDFLCVLAGFVAAHAYLGEPLELRDFLWRRIARLYPMHLFALAMFALLQAATLAALKLGMHARQDAFPGMNAANFLDTLLLLQWTGLLGSGPSWNAPSWLVATGLVCSVMAYAFLVRFGRAVLVPACIAVVVGGIGYMYANAIGPADYGPNALVRTLCDGALGCLAYAAYSRVRLVRGPFWGSFAEVVAIGAVVALISVPAAHSCWFLVVPVLAGLIYILAGEQGLIGTSLARLHRLGPLSYSLYLNTALVGSIVSNAYLSIAPQLGLTGVASATVYVALLVAFLVFYSRMTLNGIERPGAELVLALREHLAGIRWRSLFRRSVVPRARLTMVMAAQRRRRGLKPRFTS